MVRRSIFTSIVLIAAVLGFASPATQASVKATRPSALSPRSWPPDTSHYARKVLPEDLSPRHRGAISVGTFVRDVVVSNTNPNLTNTDTAGDGEPSIAINPANPNQIVLTAFSGSWGANAPVWESTDGGNTWTEQFSVPAPPGIPSAIGCPCDQNVDYGRSSLMSGTFLSFNPTDVYSGTTSNPASAAAWNWLAPGGVTQRTNSAGVGNSDQPWLLVNRDTATASQDDVFVGYDDFNGGPDLRVAVAQGTNPPNFSIDNQAGTTSLGFGTNPGHRLAVDPRTGFVYSLWQEVTAAGPGGSVNINYHLNRSTNSGTTWTLNGNPGGIVVANANSNQRNPKFGTVNALIGGVDHAAVDPTTGDLYYVYGNRDGAGFNRLSIRRLQSNGAGGLTVGPQNFVTGQVQAALPSVAIATNGRIGVLYDTFDGFSSDDFPIFTAHMALSDDHGATFTDLVLETFLSPAKDNGNNRQRVLGDYQQMKAVGRTFYGVFTGNGAPFGRPTSNNDPIFFKVPAGGPQIAVSGDLDFGLVPRGTGQTREVTIQNGGDQVLVVNGVSFDAGSDPAFSLVNNPGLPQSIQPGGSVIFNVRFRPPANSGPGLRTGTLRIQSNDPDNPTVTLLAQGQVGVPVAQVAPSSLAFGALPVDPVGGEVGSQDLPLQIQNIGDAKLTLNSVSCVAGDCSDFTVLPGPSTPLVLFPGGLATFTVRFDPTAAGPRAATIRVSSDDPVNPNIDVPATGTGLVPQIAFTGSLDFGKIDINAKKTKTVTISNAGGSNLQVTAIFLTGDTAFSIVSAPALPLILAPGGTADVQVRCTAGTDPGLKLGSLKIKSNDPVTPTLVIPAKCKVVG